MALSQRSQLTNYHSIYKKTYWGSASIDEPIESNIIVNRNKFITDYNINDCIQRNRPRRIDIFISHVLNSAMYRKYADHIEVYKTNDNRYIITINPLVIYIDDEVMEFSKIYPLYFNHATTFIKIVESWELRD